MRMWRKQNNIPEPKKEDAMEKSENESKSGGERKVGEKSASRGSSSSKAVDMEHKKKIFKKM